MVATIGFAPLATAGDLLSLVPQDALGFAAIHRLSEVDEKVSTIAQQLGLPPIRFLEMAKARHRVVKHLDGSGDVLIALQPPLAGESDPQPIVALPVKDYGKLLKEYDGDSSSLINTIDFDIDPVLVAEKEGYAVLANAENRRGLEKLLDGNDDRLDAVAKLADWIDSNDAVVVILQPGVKLATDQAISGLESMMAVFKNIEDQPAAKQAVAGLGMYVQFFRLVQNEVDLFAEGLRIDEEGNFLLGTRVRFTQEGRLAKLSIPQKDASVDLLAGLPGDDFAAAFGMYCPEELIRSLATWSTKMMKYNPLFGGADLSKEEMQAYEEMTMQSMEGVERIAFMITAGEKGDKFFENFLGVLDVEDSQHYLANYTQSMAIMERLWQKMVGQGKASEVMHTEDVTLAGVKGLKISMDMDAMLAAQNLPVGETAEMFDKIFGNDGKMTVHVLATGPRRVILSYAPEAKIEEKLAAYQQNEIPLADEPGIEKIAALLSKYPGMVGYVNPRGMLSWISNIAASILPPETNPITAELGETSPIGFSAKLVARGVEAEMVVPAELPQAVKESAKR